MKRAIRSLTVWLLIILLSVVEAQQLAGQIQQKPLTNDLISGEWEGTFFMEGLGTIQLKLNLTVDGQNVAGQMTVPSSTSEITGTWIENKLTITRKDRQGTTTLSATLQGGKLVGDIVMRSGPYHDQGTWQANRTVARSGQSATQAATAAPLMAVLTFLDGSTQKWENIEFIYEREGKTSSRLEYVAGAFGSIVVTDRVEPEPRVSIKAEYSDQLEFKHLVLTAKPEIEDRVIGTNCASTPCIAAGIRVKGLCRVSGQAKDCSAYLVPARGSTVTDKTKFIKEIGFVMR